MTFEMMFRLEFPVTAFALRISLLQTFCVFVFTTLCVFTKRGSAVAGNFADLASKFQRGLLLQTFFLAELLEL
jgi:hypothetical protein